MSIAYSKKQIRNSLLNSRECIFIIAILLKMMVETITISVIPFMVGTDICSIIFKFMTYTSYLLIIILFFSGERLTLYELFAITFLVLITVIGSYFSGNGIMLTMIYLYGAKNVNIEKVFRVLGWIYIAIFLFIVFGSIVGLVENWDFFANTNRPRWGLGYTYPTHTSSVLFMSILIFCYLKKEKINIIWVAILEVFNYWVFTYTNSRAGMMLAAMIPIVFYIIKYTKKARIDKIISWLMQWSFPICAAFIYVITMLYNGTGILNTVNRLLSERLYYSKFAMNQYGVHLTGQRIQWVGSGGMGHTRAQLTGTYNYVDTSYLKLLLENGILVWLVIMIGWTLACIIAYKHKKRYLLWTLSFLAVYCMVEQWLMNLGANPFVVFLAYPIYELNFKEMRANKRKFKLITGKPYSHIKGFYN